MKQQRNGKYFLNSMIGVFIIIVLAIGVNYQAMQIMLYQERADFFSMFSEKTIRTVETVIRNYWRNARTYEKILEGTTFETAEEVEAYMKAFGEEMYEGTTFLLYNEAGNYISSDGHVGDHSASLSDSFLEIDEAADSYAGTLPYDTHAYPKYILSSPMEEPVVLADGTTFTHRAFYMDLRLFEEIFEREGFNENVRAYLVTEDGYKIYKNAQSQGFLINDHSKNILDEVTAHARVVHGGSEQDLKASFAENVNQVFEINYNGANYFFGSFSLDSADAQLVIFIPSETISADAMNINRFSFAMTIGIVITILLVAAVLIIHARRAARHKEALVEQLSEAVEEAKRANEAKSDFLSYMSHDIRTPLNGIIGMTHIIMKHSDDAEKVAKGAEQILGASNHLLNLLNDILDLSRIERGKATVKYAPMNVNALYNDCYSIVSGQLLESKLQITKECGSISHPNVISDEMHLRQILINILGNAIKFTPEDGRVIFRMKELEAAEGKIGVQFEVEDTGIGMSEAFIRTIWEPFVQENRMSNQQYKGSGLGLAISKSFVDMLGGTISVESAQGKGTLFTMRFEFDKNNVAQQEKTEPIVGVYLAGMKVLLVEDNMLNREIAEAILEELGIEVVCAEDGQQAVDCFMAAEAGSLHAILMDMMMPVMNGLEATRAIRASAHPDATTIPIIALTANAFNEDIQKTHAAGMDAHLAKPINIEALVQTLRLFYH